VPRPQPIEWPDKAKICVTFIVPWEVWPENFATRDSHQRSSHRASPANAVFAKNMAAVSEREYGDRVGIWRLLDLFERHQLKVTMLMDGLKVEQFADVCRDIRAIGHEFASENYAHEYSYMYTREQERESIQKAIAAFAKVLGEKPTGYLSPGHSSTPHTLDLVAEAGCFAWWADPLNSDIPYTVEARGRKIVVIPYNVPGCNDYSTYGTGRTPRDLLAIMKDQFDYLYWEGEQGSPKYWTVNLHPFVSGVPYRAKVIDEFITYAKVFRRLVCAPDRDRQLVPQAGVLAPCEPGGCA
jgi:peptidoglycan/xylan/chitin deacetylase (PgdA/CDA1 family)